LLRVVRRSDNVAEERFHPLHSVLRAAPLARSGHGQQPWEAWEDGALAN
jgi:hypothetical protein